MARFRPGAAFVPPQPPLANVVPPATAALAAAVTMPVKLIEMGASAHRDFASAVTSGVLAARRAMPDLFTRGAAGGGIGSLLPRGTEAGKGGGGGGLIGGLLEATGLGALASPVGAVVAAATAATAALRGIVSVASPGTVERFDLALKDATAVVGQALTPVLEVVTAGVRLFGDFLATILPSAQDFRDALRPISDYLAELRKELAAVAPLIREALVEGLRALSQAIEVALIPFRLLSAFIEGLIGPVKDLGTSVGAAVRNISFQSAESFAKQVNIAAFKSGIGGGAESPVTAIGRNVQIISDELKKIGGTIRDILSVIPGGKALLPGGGDKSKGGGSTIDKAFDVWLPFLKPAKAVLDVGLGAVGLGGKSGGGGWEKGIANAIKEGFKDVQLPGKEGESIAEVDEGRKRGIDGFA